MSLMTWFTVKIWSVIYNMLTIMLWIMNELLGRYVIQQPHWWLIWGVLVRTSVPWKTSPNTWQLSWKIIKNKTGQLTYISHRTPINQCFYCDFATLWKAFEFGKTSQENIYLFSKTVPYWHITFNIQLILSYQTISLFKGIVHLNTIFSYMKFNKIWNLNHPVYWNYLCWFSHTSILVYIVFCIINPIWQNASIDR